jgi:hypothetical protein
MCTKLKHTGIGCLLQSPRSKFGTKINGVAQKITAGREGWEQEEDERNNNLLNVAYLQISM